ncbi:MAG: DUF126 domain-containing protein [Euryarchaeota archaeon]|nr:DUF126 domain-containing protein [Euryarchaeota archaeon]
MMRGRAIFSGTAEGEVVKCARPVVILGDIDPRAGTVEGCGSIAGKIFVFPRGAGSTVGSYTLYALRYYGTAPAAIIVEEAEPIVVAGAIISEIPTVDGIDISVLKTGMRVRVKNNEVEII